MRGSRAKGAVSRVNPMNKFRDLKLDTLLCSFFMNKFRGLYPLLGAGIFGLPPDLCWVLSAPSAVKN